MRLVNIESPFAGDVAGNKSYLRACLHDSIVGHGEAPFASHGLYTQAGVLDDLVPEQRVVGMRAGFEFHRVVDAEILYLDKGLSGGMQQGLGYFVGLNGRGKDVVLRSLHPKVPQRVLRVSTSDKAVEECRAFMKLLSGFGSV